MGCRRVNADEVRAGWARRSTEYSPAYYAYYGPNETSERLYQTLDRLVGADASVLELGCSSGRHLQHLHEHGFADLHGVDINEDAFDVMATEYPALAAAGTFYGGAIEDVVVEFEDGRFDAVVSVETLQHIHAADEWVFDELARITDDVVCTVECEAPVADTDDGQSDPDVNYVNDDIPLYYRDWGAIFTGLGMTETETQSAGRDTLRVFRHA